MRIILVIFCLSLVIGCAHNNPKNLPIARRLLLACEAVNDSGILQPEKLAEILGGKLYSRSEIKGTKFKSALLWKGKDYQELLVNFIIEGDERLTLEELKVHFNDSTIISEGKTSTVRFERIHGPCGQLYVSADLFFSKASDNSPVLSFKIRKPH